MSLLDQARKQYEKKYRKQQKSVNKPSKSKPKSKGKKGKTSGKLPKGVVDVRKLKTAKKAVNQAEPQVKELISFMKKVRLDLRKIASSASKMAGQLSGYRSVYVTVICALVGFVVVAAITGDAFRNQVSFGWALITGAVVGVIGYSITEAVDK